MTLAVDLPECQQSLVGRLDGRWRLASLLVAGGVCIVLRHPAPAFVSWLATLSVIALAHLPWRWLLPRWGLGLLMIFLFGVWLPFVPERGDTTYSDVGIPLYVGGLQKFAVLLMKTGSLLGLMLVALASAPLHESLHALQALYVPRLLIQVILLAYRYLHVLAEEFRRIRVALRVRGFKSRADFRTYHTVGKVAGTLLVRSHERSERVAQAMRCRGFSGRFPSIASFRTGLGDVLFLLTLAAGFAAILLWDLWS